MLSQTYVNQNTVAVEFPSVDRGSGRQIENAEGVFDVAQTRRYFVQVGRKVEAHNAVGYEWEVVELDLLVPAGIYMNRTEKQAIEAHCETRWEGYDLLGCMVPLDCEEF